MRNGIGPPDVNGAGSASRIAPQKPIPELKNRIALIIKTASASPAGALRVHPTDSPHSGCSLPTEECEVVISGHTPYTVMN